VGGSDGKESMAPKLSSLNPLDYHVWSAMLEKYHKLLPKPELIDELKVSPSGKSCHKTTSTRQWQT